MAIMGFTTERLAPGDGGSADHSRACSSGAKSHRKGSTPLPGWLIATANFTKPKSRTLILNPLGGDCLLFMFWPFNLFALTTYLVVIKS